MISSIFTTRIENRLLKKGLRTFLFLVILLISVTYAKGQTVDSARYNTPSQDIISVYFSGNVTLPNLTGWTLNVGGTIHNPGAAAPGFTIQSISGNRVNLKLTFTFPKTNIQYADVVAGVRVIYNGLGSLTVGGAPMGSFNILAINNVIIDCSMLSSVQNIGTAASTGPCQSVTIQLSIEWTWQAQARNSTHFTGTTMIARVFWRNLTDTRLSYTMSESVVGSGKFTVITTPFTYQVENKCVFSPTAYPILQKNPLDTKQPTLSCAGGVNQQNYVIPAYRLDNEPLGGLFQINPAAGSAPTLFCVGENITAFVFNDATSFNCNVSVELDRPNQGQRWMRFVYGTHATAGIPNVFINVFGTMVQVTDINGDVILGPFTVDPLGNPVAPYMTTNGFEGQLFTIPDPCTAPIAQTYPIHHTGSFVTDAANDVFGVTLQNWGPCNKYTDLANPIETYSELKLVLSPPLPTAPDVTICFNGSTTLTAVRNGTNPGELYWYNNSDLLPIHQVGTGTTYNPGALAPGVYHFWVREIGTTGMLCEGPAEEVILTIKEELLLPGVISGPAEVCIDATGQVFSLAVDPPTMPFGGVTDYQWSVPAGWTITAGQGTKQITVNIGGTTGTQTLSVLNRYPTLPNCPSPSRTFSVTVSPLSVGGTITGGSTPICTGTSTGTMTLAGHTGSIVRWEKRLNAGAWTNIANTLTTYSETPSSVGTWDYRALVQSGSCASAYSSIRTIVVDPTSVGGTITGGTTPICFGSNTGIMTLSGHTGSISRWEKRVNAGAWANIAITTTTYSEVPSSAGTWEYRARVVSGSCPAVYSSTLTIVVDPTSVGGTITGGTTPLCLGSGTGTMTLSGHTGSVTRWERRINAGAWTNIANTTTTYSETPASAGTREYRALVTSGTCAPAYSSIRTIVINPTSVGGTLSGGSTPICQGTNTGIMTVTGYTGSITRWEKRVNAGAWSNIANTNTTYSEVPSSAGTWEYRVLVTSSPCAGAYSTIVTIVVDPTSVGGSITGGTTPLCLGSNTGVMTLSGHTGSVTRWERRLNAGAWVNIANTTTTHSEVPASAGTWDYRALVTSGTCAPVYSSIRTIVVDPASVGGSITGGSTPICYGINTGVMTLSGHTGSITRWEKRVDAGAWTNIANTTTTYSEVPSASGTWEYRALVQSGSCPSAYSAVRTIVVRPRFQLAQLMDNASICSGTSTNFNIVMTGGVGPYTVNYTKAGVAQPVLNNYVSGTNVSTGVLVSTTIFALTSVTDANGCPVESMGTTITVTVGSVPTTATLTGSGDACSGASSSIRSVITGGAPPYVIKYTRNGVAQADITNYSSGTNYNLGVLADGAYIYQITQVTDACGNNVPGGGLPGTYTININSIPDISATAPATQTICNDASASITLNSTVNNTIFNYAVTSVPAAGYSWTALKNPVAGTITDVDGNGTETLTRQLQHNYTAPVTVTYTITPTGPGATACPGAPVSKDVVVNPTAVITSALTKTICDNASTAYTITSSTAGATFAWSRAAVAGISNAAGSGTGSAINENLDNTTTAPVNVTYILTPSYGACPGTPSNLVVTVQPTPVITSALTSTKCNNTALGYTITSSTAGATFAWSRAAVAGISNAANSGTGSSINESLVNTTTAPVNVTYVLTPSIGSCTGTPSNLVVTVQPTPVITSALTSTVCDNTALGYTITSSTAGATFAWSRAAVAGISNAAGSGTGSSINESLDNTTTAPVNVTYVLTPSIGGCTGTPSNLVVTVNPTPVITSSLAVTKCNNTALGYTITSSTAGATFAWSRAAVAGISNAANSGTGSSINESLVNTTTAPVNVTYVLTPSIGSCTGTPSNLVVTVQPTAVITSALTDTKCNNTALGYTITSSTAGATFAWSRAAIAGISNPANSGTGSSINESLTNTTAAPVNVTYVLTPSIGGCTGTPSNLVVTVNPTAVITSALTKTICDNASTAYTITSSTAGATFAWSRAAVAGIANPAGSGTGSALNENLDNTTTAPVNVTYVLTPSYGGCTGTPSNLVVTVQPTAVITSSLAVTKCNNTALGYTITSSTAGATFAWSRAAVAGISNAANSGTGSSINESLVNTTASPVNVTYVLTPSIGSCTGTPSNLIVTVNPTAVITSAATGTVCDNTLYSYTATSSTAGATFAWTRAAVAGISNAAGSGATALISETLDNTTAASVNVTYVITPSYAGCTGTPFNHVVTVYPTPTLSSTLTPADVCSNSAFSYVPTSATAGTSFNWSRASVPGITPAGPTSGTGNPNETLRNITNAPIAVTYQYTLTANGCSNIQNVVVNIKPEPVITAGQNVSVCSGIAMNYQVLLNNFTNPGDGVTFTWPAPVLAPVNPGFTGGSARAVASALNITDTYTNTMGVIGTATYTITPYKNGCAGTPVTVVANIGAQPVLDPGLNKFACSNSAIGLLLKEAAGSVVPSHYNIISVTLAGGLVADAGNVAIPSAVSPAGYLSNDKYLNTTGVDKTVTYRVQPVLAPDCFGAPVDVVITIRPQPVVMPAQIKTVCSNTAIGKEILLVPANTPAGTVFNWSAPTMSDLSVQGTAGVNVAADPAGTIHINDVLINYLAAPITATYNVIPTSSFGCSGTSTPVVITINPEPAPQPISGRDKICITDKNLVYSVNPVGGSTFHWTVDPAVGTKTFDFNTNAILVDAAAVAGSGNITVYETNSFSCNGQPSTKAVQVYVAATPEVIGGPSVVCQNSTQVYSVTNRLGSVYSWTVPGGAAIIGDPSKNTITVVWANTGGSILVRETNAAGCITDHTPLSVTVNPLPTAQISGSTTICSGGSANLTVDFTGTGPYTFTYAINGVTQPLPISTAADPYTLNVTAAGSYTIVDVTDANCTSTGTGSAVVTYYPQPTGIISGTSTLCKGNSTTLTFTFTGTAPYTFTYTDGTTPVTVTAHPTAVYTVSVSPLSTTTYTLTSLTDGNTCTGVVSGSAVITVNIPPVLTLAGTNLTCYNDNTGAVDLTATGNSPFGFAWTGPDLFTANTEDITGLKAGVYSVVVTDTKACTSTANITITQPAALNATLASTNLVCFGAANGTITISAPSGGTGTYEYSINGGGAWQASGSFTGLVPGTYNVMMRDAVSTVCTKVLDPARVITGPAVMTATVAFADADCFSANNGSITITAPAGGSGLYQYSVNGGGTWQGSGSFTNLAPATYNVQMRDANTPTCVITLNGAVVINQPAQLTATLASNNITCFGAADGTITLSAPTGGHGTYEYSINGGSSWQASGNFTGLAPATYNVLIRDAAVTTCYRTLNGALAITQPAVLNATIATTAVTCNGANDGIINITAPSGGYGTYEYSINGGGSWQASGNYTALAPGSYDVRIRDAANTACVVILNNAVSITEPAALSALVSKTDITCFGANNGVINITNPAGGYGTYEYSINGGTTWAASGNFSGLLPNTYNVQIRDKVQTACVKVLDGALVITEPAVLSAAVASTNVTCNGASDGTITISGAAGGYGTYQYSVNGGATWQGSGNFINLAPASYNVRIRDAANPTCVIVLNPALVITQPAVLSATVVKTNVTCFGAADGTITINGAAGGYGTYEYTVTGGAAWQASNTFTGLIPGFYNVKIRDAANPACIVTLNGSLNITEPAILNANVAKTNVTCNGANNGTITVSSPTGGGGTYQYSINGGGAWQASGSFTALAPATYDVRIRDAANTACVITLNASVVITEPAALTATVASTNVTCFGANNGTITISGSAGGYGTYEYSINGGTTWSGLGTFTNLVPNTYDVRIRDAANTACVVTLNGALVITQPAVLSATVAKTNVTCFGAADGTITISAPAGGYGTYEYTVNGGGSWQASGNFTNLGPGNYNVQIRDAAYTTCVIVLNNSLSITQPAVLNAVVTPTMVTCNGANDGIIAITAPTGGYGTYEYSVNGGSTWQASGTFSGLAPASYDVRIRDAANTACVITLNSALVITEPAILAANLASANVSCFGANDGTITITAPTGGYGTYEYSISGGTTWQATGNFSGLAPNTYNVQIRDKAHTGCVKVLNAALVITEPAILNATVASTNVTCNGANNGTITVSAPTGGYGTYQYTVNGGAAWQGSGNFTNLAPGVYDVRIRDAAHIACEITLSPALNITQPAVLSATVARTNVTCFGAADGTITISAPAGGYGTYEYTVDGGATWQASGNFTGLTPGFYNVKIRDAANNTCIVTLNGSLQVTEPAILAAVVVKTNVTCNGANDGTITISSPTGGYGTYGYTVNGGTTWQASGNFTGLAPNTYDVKIRDAANPSCIITLNGALVITEPAALTATVASTNVTCFGANNGTITISGAAGGYGTYQYTINGGTSWQGLGTFTNLAPNTYDVKIRDAANPACVVTLNGALVITQPAVLSATVAKTNVTCFGAADGTITISAPAGGYGTYEYTVNGGGSWQASGNFTNLGPGSYNVQIRDAAYTSCVIVLSNALSITQPAVLNAVVTPTMVTCNGANDGKITITAASGGYGTYEYSINGGGAWQASGNFTALAPASYDVRIRDAANTACVITLNPALVITEPAILSAVVSKTDITCFGANNGTITVSAPTGGYGTYEYTINGGTTWQATGNFSGLTPASYNVQIRDKAQPACVMILNAALNISEPAELDANVASTNVTCNGANNGTITITAPTGGYGTYEYSINSGATWQPSGNFTNLAPATYNVRIRDAANTACVIVLNPALVITQPAVLSATVAKTNVTCFGAADGTITITAPAGGYGTYEYTVNGGAAWQASGNFTALAPGFYNVQIRDAAYPTCVVTLNGSLQITQPAVLAGFVGSTNVTCNGANDGTITITGASGGYGTYEYSVNGGGVWQASATFSGLIPGTYNVQIRDAANTGCVIVLDGARIITEPAVLNATVTPTMVTCFGANDGKITITSPTGGYGTYQYSINGGTSWQGSGTFTGLAPAIYDVRIRDAVNTGCVITLNGGLVITQPAVLTATISSTNVTCFGGSDGSITISAPSGGYGTYEYSINGGGSWQASGAFSALSPGTYNILIRDAAHTGCVIVLNNAYSVTQPPILAATVAKTDVTCNGANNGTITISSPTGGYGTYEYSINGGGAWQASGTFSGLVPGTYDVRIRDAANTACSVILYPNLIISEPLVLTLTTSGNVLLDCFGDMDGTGTFYAAGGTLPYTFSLVSNTTGGVPAAPGFNSQAIFAMGAGAVTYTVTDSKGCSATATITVTQPADLTPGAIGSNQVICNGSNPAMLTQTAPPTGGPAAYTYQWQYSNNIAGPFINIAGANASTYTPPVNATATLYYRRMVTSGTCLPVYSNVVEVLVNPRPVGILTGGETICPGSTSMLKVNLPIGTGPFELDIENYPGLTVSGYVSDADIPVTPAATTTYKLLRIRDANGCQVTFPSTNMIGSATVTVRALPAITVQPVNKTTCEFGMVTYSLTATGSDLTYQWYVDQGSGFTALADGGVYFGAQSNSLMIFGATRDMNNYSYRAIVTGCATDVTSNSVTLTVNTAPEILTQPTDSTICQGANAAFAVTAQGTALVYQWQRYSGGVWSNVTDNANFSGSTSPTLSLLNVPGSFNNYMFRVKVTGTCGVPVYSNFVFLRVNVPPTVTLQPVNKSICANGGPVFFTGNGSGLIDSLRWQVSTNSGATWADINDGAVYSGTTSQQLTLINVPGTYNGYQYRLALKAFCTTTYTNAATLTVNANPIVDFTAVSPINACGGVPKVLNGNPTGGSGTYTQHTWTGDVGPLSNYFIQSPTFNSQIAGTYSLIYKVKDSNGCTAENTLQVIVDAPDATFMPDINLGCTPLTVNFTKDMTGISKFWWNFGDGSPKDSVNANPTHIFTNIVPSAIEYRDVELKVMSAGGCYDTYKTTITIYPEIDASFTANKSIVCSGGTITFSAQPGAKFYNWEFGDGMTSPGTNVITHQYTSPGPGAQVLTVRLTTTSFYNCTNTQTITITVMPVPIPNFTPAWYTDIYNAAGNTNTFTNTTNAGTWTWSWKFGDGGTSTAQHPSHTYTNIGNYDVWLKVSNANCSDSIMKTVRVMPVPPVANFDSIPSGCSPLYVAINNTSQNVDVPGTTYQWDFGDGSPIVTVKNPTYTYFTSGTYRITLIVTGPYGDMSMKSQVVNAYASPKSYFEVTPTTVYVNDERVRCFNLSQGADWYVWEFGDGDTSRVKDPFHKYMKEGVFDITLHSYKYYPATGVTCKDSWTLSPGVTVEPAGVIRFATVFTPNKDSETEPDIDNINANNMDQFFYPPIREEVLNYKLQIFNRWGTLIFQSNDIRIPWNGYYKHKLCKQGVYVWFVEGKYANGKPFRKTGDITLLH